MMCCPALALVCALAQDPAVVAESGYRQPPPEVVRIVDAQPTPRVELSPDGRWMLLVERPALPSIAEVSRPWIPLGGLRVDPRYASAWRSSYSSGVVLRDLADGTERRLALPAGARIASTSIAHTSRHAAIVIAAEGGGELWVVELSSGADPERVATSLNGVFGAGYAWLADGEHLVGLMRPADPAEAPAASAVPKGPRVQETRGQTTPVRTYQDLLRDRHDEELFDHFARTQVAIVSVGGDVRTLEEPGPIVSALPSPNGRHLLVELVVRPYSHVLPYGRFPRRFEVWNVDAGRERVVAEVPLGENIPLHGVRTGPRGLRWRAGADATLAWLEALDGGDPEQEVPHRDRWMTWAAPFLTGAAEELVRVEHRAWGITWFERPSQFLTLEYDRDENTRRTLLHDTERPGEVAVLDERDYRDRYADPGTVVTRVGAGGFRVVLRDGDWIYRIGSGASSEGDRPFVARHDLATGETVRLWRCIPGTYERPIEILASGPDRLPAFITRYETPDDPPNYRLRDLHEKRVEILTKFEHPAPELVGIAKELLRYERADGVSLSATLYLPKDHVDGERLPLIVWAYPLEYDDGDTAGQVRGSPYRFTYPRGSSHLLFLTQGYAVLDGAAMPVVGDPETVNDTFVEQVVASARAAIGAAVARGCADGQRVGVGGHSYGAFMTANLLAHCDLFRAGIARSGAYNRTLTPFGFQSERRTLWEAPAAYFAISPFLHAEKIDEPLLLIHGADDTNPGTFPLQSERLFHAVKGNGGVARHVELPAEGHGYRARESVLHVLAEMFDWCDEHVKGAETPAEAGFSR